MTFGGQGGSFARGGEEFSRISGWTILIPFFNTSTMIKVAKRLGWLLILFFNPVVCLVMGFAVAIDVAKSFGKGAGFGALPALFPFIVALVLGR